MTERERYRAPPPPEPPPHRVRASDLYPRLRTQYDEPGLDAGFVPICGEFIQWVGRTAEGGTIAMSNYRLHLQPRRRASAGASVPLRLIDALEIRDLLCLLILCKHGRQLKCTFSSGEQCMEWWRRLNTALAPMGSLQETFAAAYAAWAREQPPASVHRALIRASHAPRRHWFGPEVERLGFTTKGAWRVTAANAEYKLCPSYPPLLVVPASICDEDLDSVARFRAMRRIPTVVWRHRGTGAVLARSSQPEVGWLGWRSSEDERLLAAFVSACAHDRGLLPPAPPNKQAKLLIVDARSYASAVTNRARGGGCECQQYYPLADIQFMCLPNIHHVRRSFHQMRALLADPSDQTNWHSSLERTLWLQYVAGVARAGALAARAAAAGRPVLVHCSDGWDRTPQILAVAQLLLDPHYRTLEGFRVLIEREWLDFGHKFADRCGHQFGPEDPNERSPIFLQWLDVVYQMMLQYPCSFEFNEAYLIKLATHVHSCMFGTFLCNTGRERAEGAAGVAHVWQLLRAPAYRNHLYTPRQPDHIWPDSSVRAMQVWWGMYCGERERDRDPPRDRAAPDAPACPPANGLMTKTRSCDNLLNEGEKRTTQRRCSDPSLAPDVMKLSMVVNGSACRGALTDSCVDELPPQPTDDSDTQDQVDGLQAVQVQTPVEVELPEGGRVARDITSDSSSLERELAAPAAAGFVCDSYTDVLGIAEAAKESGRTRNISITWRSISESSNQSSTGFDIAENSPQAAAPAAPTNHNRQNGLPNGAVNGVDDIATKFLEVDLNGGGSASGSSSESDGDTGDTGEAEGAEGTGGAGARASQLTLCPASPRRAACCHCARRHHPPAPPTPTPASGDGVALPRCAAEGGRCVCGAGARPPPDSLDGLPPLADPLQARLHQIILYQKKVVEELSGQLREAREALRRASSPVARVSPPAPLPAPAPAQGAGSCSGSSGAASGSSSGSGSEVEVGEEARGVVWLPDSAAPRCQHCRNHFWLARRRHHCRRCGGIFCGSCSEMSAWGECGAVRVCRRCRAMR